MQKAKEVPLSLETGSVNRLCVYDGLLWLGCLLEVADEAAGIFARQVIELHTIRFEGHLTEFLNRDPPPATQVVNGPALGFRNRRH